MSLLRVFGDDRGNAAIIFCLLATPLIVVAGAGVDLMGHERERARAQAALDAGLIAAASLTQTEPAETIVPQYFAGAGITGYQILVTEQRTINSRKVTATATKSVPTAFLRLARISVLPVKVTGQAEETIKNMELSLVLDISGSMALEGRVDAMKPAAQSFIDQILTSQNKPYTSISLIPFAGQTNVGKTMFQSLVGSSYKIIHNLSYNFDYRDQDFVDSIPNFSQIGQVQYFGTNASVKGYEWAQNPDNGDAITYLSNDANTLKSKIGALKMYDGTGTQIAMTWAYHLLDPAFRTRLQSARASDPSLYPPAFSARPVAYNDPDSVKFVVLMTDGAVYAQSRPRDKTTPVFQKNTHVVTDYGVVGDDTVFKLFSQVCSAMKGKGITIFTIGFGSTIKNDAKMQGALQACASSPAKFYLASTSDISKVFSDIARTISPLRLTN